MNSSAVSRVIVSADGAGVVSDAGASLLREVADLTELSPQVTAVLADTYKGAMDPYTRGCVRRSSRCGGRRRVLIRSDSAGATYRFATACRNVHVGFPLGAVIDARVRHAGRGAQHRQRLVSGH